MRKLGIFIIGIKSDIEGGQRGIDGSNKHKTFPQEDAACVQSVRLHNVRKSQTIVTIGS